MSTRDSGRDTARRRETRARIVEAAMDQFGRNVALEPGDGRVRLTMSDEGQLPAQAHWVVQNGHNLYELTPTHLSLEDRFLQVVGEESDE